MSTIAVSEVNDGKHVCENCPMYREVDYVTSSAQQMADHVLAHDLRDDVIPVETFNTYSPLFEW